MVPSGAFELVLARLFLWPHLQQPWRRRVRRIRRSRTICGVTLVVTSIVIYQVWGPKQYVGPKPTLALWASWACTTVGIALIIWGAWRFLDRSSKLHGGGTKWADLPPNAVDPDITYD
jgi:hypothetical protein